MPPMLRADLLRTTDALHMTAEFEEYRRQFPDTGWVSLQGPSDLAQVVVIGYNGRAPRKEEVHLDIPISLSALQLVLLNRGVIHASNRQERRVADSVLYGLNGRVVRVALPRLVPQKTQVSHESITLVPRNGEPITGQSQLMYNGTALAEKSLSDRMPGITTKALARAAVKFTAAEAATRGSQHAVNKGDAAWVGLLVGLLTHGLAVASEVADTRSWRTLPDEIQISRLWVPAGEYESRIQPVLRQRRSSPSRGVSSAGPSRRAHRLPDRTGGVMKLVTGRGRGIVLSALLFVAGRLRMVRRDGPSVVDRWRKSSVSISAVSRRSGPGRFATAGNGAGLCRRLQNF
jgi:hypothetical protein